VRQQSRVITAIVVVFVTVWILRESDWDSTPRWSNVQTVLRALMRAHWKQFLRAEPHSGKKHFKGAKGVCLDLSQKTELNNWSGRADDFRTFVPLSVSSEILKPHSRLLSQTRCDNVHYNNVMQQPFTRDRIIEVLRTMPADATVDDAIERLVFLAKIESGLAELDRSEGLPHGEARSRFGL
jgi:hypothetical protein